MKTLKSRILLRLVLPIGAGLIATQALASTNTDTIAKILLDSSGNIVYVYPTNGIPGVPACGAGQPYYSFLFTRPMASAYLAGLLSAQARGASVTLYGSSTCSDQSISETVQYFSINN
jgi:hypothetical protein